MLSDHERAALIELERGLVAQDPNFARSFDSRSFRGSGRLPPHGPGRACLVAFVLAALLSVFMLVAGSSFSALAFAAVAGVAWVAWGRGDGTRPRQT